MRPPRHVAVPLAVPVASLAAALLAGTGLSAQAAPQHVPPAAPAAAYTAPVVGSPSGGDPYFPKDGNGGYDVEHYRIRTTYRPATDVLRGRTVLRAVADRDLSAFHLDLALTADEVVVDGVRAGFSKPDRHTLRVEPRRLPRAEEPFVVEVGYHGRPSTTRAAGISSPFTHVAGEGTAIGEPQNGAWWFAANETPADKATYDIAVRVPRGNQALSNGMLVARKPHGRWTTWRWRMDDPMTTYLAFFAAGRFDVERGTRAGLPSLTAVSERLPRVEQRHWRSVLRRTGEVVAWLSRQYGPYPFDAVGGVAVASEPGYALESQSRPVYDGRYRSGVSLVVHEQAHQWFGNTVAVRRWKDIWLNEGFASYAEWAWRAAQGGRTVERSLRASYDLWADARWFWELRISDPGPDQLFDPPVYERGAMALAALRNVVGEADFDRLLRRWVADHRHGHGTVAEFRGLAEQASGAELSGFFDEWLDHTDRPANTEANGLGDLAR